MSTKPSGHQLNSPANSPEPSALRWVFRPLEELTGREVYDLLKLRQDVFILEQKCIYPDIDAFDLKAYHLLGYRTDSGKEQLVLCSRVLPGGTRFFEPSIGRVVSSHAVRRSGLGVILMRESIAHTQRMFPGQGIRISAQAYLQSFYTQLGFNIVGEEYLEDDIPHIEMFLHAPAHSTEI